jgi:hypothetical protein
MGRVVRVSLSLAALLLFAAAAFVSSGFALMAAPVFLLMLLLFNGIRPGERLIERHRRRPAPARMRRTRERVLAPRMVYRRGRLVVSGLAMRPPPAAGISFS